MSLPELVTPGGSLPKKVCHLFGLLNHLSHDMMTSSMTMVTVAADAELVHASLAGNRDAFGQIVSRYQSLVCSVAYSSTGNLEQSEDVAQDTFVTAWKHLADLRDPANLRGWLCGIARNLVNNLHRRQQREPSHSALSLDELQQVHSSEPLPIERAISQEEADLLWRSLEKIPENYRVPLVLFYREHQSVEAVAQKLDLTEDAVKQRLSRGRKMLQDEIVSFVESALEKTSPGKTFTLGVVAALPLGITTAKAASASAVAAKVGTGKAMLSLTGIAAFLSMVGAIFFSWKNLVDDSASAPERKFMVRMGRYQVLFFVLTLLLSIFLAPLLSHRPWICAPLLAGLILLNVLNAVLIIPYILRQRFEIRSQEGTLTDSLEKATQQVLDRAFDETTTAPPGISERDAVAPVPALMTRAEARRRTFKLTIPFLIMFAGMVVVLPWKLHWKRSAVLTLGEALLIVWFFWRTSGRFMHPLRSISPAGPAFLQNPFLRFAAVIFGAALLGGIGGYLLPFFLNPNAAGPALPHARWLVPFAVSMLLAVIAFALLCYLPILKFLPKWKWLAAILDSPFIDHIRTMRHCRDAALDLTYGPLLQQLPLTPEARGQLKALVVKRAMIGVRPGMALLNPRLSAAERTALVHEIQTKTDAATAEIATFLGNDNYAVFREFEKTLPDRMLIDSFKKCCARTATPLTLEQQARLLKAITQARRDYPWTTDLSRRNHPAVDNPPFLTQAYLNTFAEEEKQFATKFNAEAQPILQPELWEVFKEVQQRQLESKLSQLKMTVKLFAPASKP